MQLYSWISPYLADHYPGRVVVAAVDETAARATALEVFDREFPHVRYGERAEFIRDISVEPEIVPMGCLLLRGGS